jgi:hypothetical protein
MPTGLTQKPTADAAGGSRTCVLTLHVIIVATRFPAGTIARRVQEIRATCGRDRASPRRSRFSEPHAAPRTAAAPSPASPALPRRASSRERGCVSENLSHVPEPFTLIRRSSWDKVWPCLFAVLSFSASLFPYFAVRLATSRADGTTILARIACLRSVAFELGILYFSSLRSS